LAAGQADGAIEMYKTVHQFDEAIAVAESRRHPAAKQMREDYFGHLLATRQVAPLNGTPLLIHRHAP
jgi:intraflagellar transport protein 172